MFVTIVKKEILDALLSYRFAIATVLCLVLIPLGMYVNLKEYERRMADYQEAVQLYQQESKGKISADFQAEGYRPPSILSIFSAGLEQVMPNKFTTSSNGVPAMTNVQGVDNAQSLLFGKLDMLFNVVFVVSLLALIFSFATITGEKEAGTLRMMSSNPVPRIQILLAKVAGTFIVLLLPFTLAILLSLIILSGNGMIPIFSSQLLPRLLAILAITIIFMFSMSVAGLLISALSHRSLTAMTSSLLVWTVFVLAIPRASPMVADVFHPVHSRQVKDLQQRLSRTNLEREQRTQEKALYQAVCNEFGIPDGPRRFPPETEGGKKLVEAYDQRRDALQQSFARRIAEESDNIDREFNRQQTMHARIAAHLSRLSPVSCYTYLVTDFCATGVQESDNADQTARRFQAEVTLNLYDKFIMRSYQSPTGPRCTLETYAPGFDPGKTDPPVLFYQHASMLDVLSNSWLDLGLLLVYASGFLIAAYAAFQRYDVR